MFYFIEILEESFIFSFYVIKIKSIVTMYFQLFSWSILVSAWASISSLIATVLGSRSAFTRTWSAFTITLGWSRAWSWSPTTAAILSAIQITSQFTRNRFQMHEIAKSRSCAFTEKYLFISYQLLTVLLDNVKNKSQILLFFC